MLSDPRFLKGENDVYDKACYEDHKIVYAAWCLHCAGPSAEGTLSPAPFSYSWEPQRHPRQRFLYCLGARAHLGLRQRATKYPGTRSTDGHSASAPLNGPVLLRQPRKVAHVNH